MCDCITKINALLAEHNGTLETNWLSNPSRAMVSVCRVESRKRKPPLMEATCCPFCGDRYPKKRELATIGMGASLNPRDQ